jgi:hypothetical protein
MKQKYGESENIGLFSSLYYQTTGNKEDETETWWVGEYRPI